MAEIEKKRRKFIRYVGDKPVENRLKKIIVPTYYTLSNGLDIPKANALVISSLVLCLMILKALRVELFQRNL